MSTELENRIKSEFDNINLDSVRLIKANLANSSETKNNIIKIRYINSSARKAAAAIAILLSLTITAIAAGTHLEAFEKLREIIGDKQADTLKPIHAVREFTTDDGFKIELAAVGVLSNVVDFYFTLEDLNGQRLDDNITISASVFPADNQQTWTAIIQNPKVIGQTEEGAVILHSRQQFSTPITGQQLQFSLRYISYNQRKGKQELNFDLSSLTTQAPDAYLWNTPLLKTHLHDIKLEVPEFDNTWNTSLSSIGIIDGKLHIQQIQEPPAPSQNSRAHFALTNQNGDYLPPCSDPQWPLSFLSFKIDENGKPINEPGHLPYREDIYEIDLDRLSEYRIAVEYNTEERIYLNWDVNFEIDLSDNNAELAATGLDLKLETSRVILREVRITPYNIIINADYIEELSYSPNPAIIIKTTEDTLTPQNDSTMLINHFDELTGSLTGFTIVENLIDVDTANFKEIELFDLDSVISVEIEGQIIEFR